MATKKNGLSVAALKAKLADATALNDSAKPLPMTPSKRPSAYELAMEQKRNGTLSRKVMTERGWVCPD